jgi:hypothetical protein
MGYLESGIHTIVKLNNNKIRLSKKFIIEEIINLENNQTMYNSVINDIKKPSHIHESKLIPVYIRYTIISNNTNVKINAHFETLGSGKINITHVKNLNYKCCMIQ